MNTSQEKSIDSISEDENSANLEPSSKGCVLSTKRVFAAVISQEPQKVQAVKQHGCVLNGGFSRKACLCKHRNCRCAYTEGSPWAQFSHVPEAQVCKNIQQINEYSSELFPDLGSKRATLVSTSNINLVLAVGKVK